MAEENKKKLYKVISIQDTSSVIVEQYLNSARESGYTVFAVTDRFVVLRLGYLGQMEMYGRPTTR